MKKTLAAVAVLGAFAGSAMAANVELYGSVSTGLVFSHTDSVGDESAQNSVTMESAWAGDSVFGLTGEEELGNGWKVGFALENEFSSDTGALATDGKLFDSMSYLWVGNDTIKLAAGNLGGALSSAGGDFDLVGDFDPLEAAYGVGGMGLFASRDLAFDNALALELTPIDGLTVSLQASLEDEDQNSGWSQRDHYYGVGAKYENGPLALSLVAERIKPANGKVFATDVDDDGNGVTANYKATGIYTFGASWDFEVVKPTFMYQHTDNMRLSQFAGDFTGITEEDPISINGSEEKYAQDMMLDTDSFLLGATAPLGNGTLGVSAQYAQVKFVNDTKSDKGNAYTFGVAYSYELSKRTNLYAAGVYTHGTKDLKDCAELNGYQIGFGLNHTF